MRVGTYDEAVKQAKANAKLTGDPWVVFAWNFAWHCESKLTNNGINTVVMPDGEILSHEEYMDRKSKPAAQDGLIGFWNGVTW